MRRSTSFPSWDGSIPASFHWLAQSSSSPSTEHAQVSLRTPPRAEAPPAEPARNNWSDAETNCSSEKAYLDALDYYRAALAQEPR